MLKTNLHFITVDKSENFDLQCLWNLESSGIGEEKNALSSQKDFDFHNNASHFDNKSMKTSWKFLAKKENKNLK